MNGISSTASRSSFRSLPDAPQPQPTGAASPQPASSPSTPGNSQTLTRMARDARPPLAGQQQAAAADAKGAATGASQLNIDDKGHVQHERVLLKTAAGRETISPKIERKEMPEVNGLVIHQTDSPTVSSTLNSYALKGANGAHFLIDKDGTIYQTASLKRKTNHVGPLRSRCAQEKSCSPEETELNEKFNPTKENQRESKKPAGERFPSNSDSIGIELVGMSYKAKSHQETSNLDGSFNFLITTTDGKTLKYENLSADVASRMREEIKESKLRKKYYIFEQVTTQQNESLQWLTQQLRREYSIPESEVFAHPTVSRKTGSEALTAQWR
ncbi:N-acetylmuramoyl-L-alanine amidase [Ottowia massiliensis]|uniref:N-acetylmuramoyl-L-alanine amidase n=1 Tax=Ottowia massiliensis TaxID=2045302 RepID=UPI000C822C71|nr:N-acetylmuramoyl-L-alanine amidase [Ottowia massiliensis]